MKTTRITIASFLGKPRWEKAMKRTLNTMLAIVCVAAVLGGIQAQAQETRSPLVRQLYNGNFPPEEEALGCPHPAHFHATLLPSV